MEELVIRDKTETENGEILPRLDLLLGGMQLQGSEIGDLAPVHLQLDRLGGTFNEAAFFSFKGKDRDLLKYYATQMEKAKITIHYNTEIQDAKNLDFDEVIVATGHMKERLLNIPGNNLGIPAVQFIKNGMQCGDRVAIIGGGETGCEMAYELAMQGKHPFVVEMQDDILKIKGTCMANTSYLRDAFEYYKVPVYTSAKATAFSKESITIEKDGVSQTIPVDTIVVSIGFESGTQVKNADGKNAHIIGDADHIANLLNATHSAYDAVMLFS